MRRKHRLLADCIRRTKKAKKTGLVFATVLSLFFLFIGTQDITSTTDEQLWHPSEPSKPMRGKGLPFNISRAIMSPGRIRKRSVEQLYRMYNTSTLFIEEIKKLTKVLKVKDLPTTKAGETCVIVGSSGKLLNYPKMGSIVDSYDHVIRMNFAPTTGFETFVGTKTSLNIGYYSSVKVAIRRLEVPVNTTILFSGVTLPEWQKVRWTLEHATWDYRFVEALKRNRIVLYGEYTKKWIQANLFECKRRPMTGLITMTIISGWCPTKPDFVGFNLADSNARDGTPYHYFDGVSLHFNTHSPDKERDAIRKLQLMGLIGKDLFQN